jgi:uncharacterized protein
LFDFDDAHGSWRIVFQPNTQGAAMTPLLSEFLHNFTHNLFKPLLLFFYMGFLIPVLRIPFEFPYVIYQGLTMYLLIAIGWHGGEELASLPLSSLQEAVGFMAIGFLTNLFIGVIAYQVLRRLVGLRKIDAATVAGYYGSDSAGTFVTCVGVLATVGIAYQAYMPVMLAVMEIPGCLVALFLVSRLRHKGLDANGFASDEVGYNATAVASAGAGVAAQNGHSGKIRHTASAVASKVSASHAAADGDKYDDGYDDGHQTATAVAEHRRPGPRSTRKGDDAPRKPNASVSARHQMEMEDVAEMAMETIEGDESESAGEAAHGKSTGALLHEVFLNPGIYLLFGGIAIGFVSRLQGSAVTAADDSLFVTMFQGILCLFLLEMGITASKRLFDLKQAGWKFILFGVLAPNVFATIGIAVAHCYSMILGTPFELGTYVLFAVLCGAASYIAVPAVQRLAIPEASPTLPLAASLGLTFTYNVTIGIPVYILIARVITTQFPVLA